MRAHTFGDVGIEAERPETGPRSPDIAEAMQETSEAPCIIAARRALGAKRHPTAGVKALLALL